MDVPSAGPHADPSSQPESADDSTQRAAIVAASIALAADVAAARAVKVSAPAPGNQSDEAVHASHPLPLTSSGHADRRALPIDRADPAGGVLETKLAHGAHGGHHTDTGADTPADANAPQPQQVSKRVEFARALQAGVEIAASTSATPVVRPAAQDVPVRTALPMFAAPMTAAPRSRAEAPVVIGAPTPPTPAPLTIVPVALRDMTAMALRLSAPDGPALQAPAHVETDAVGPQIVQTLRVAWSRGAGEAQIRLDPRQFGDLSVSLRVEAGQVVARVQADAPAVREWLQSNQRTLQAGLAEHQLRLGRLEVVAPGDEARDATDAQGRRREGTADDPPARRPRRRESTGSFEVVA